MNEGVKKLLQEHRKEVRQNLSWDCICRFEEYLLERFNPHAYWNIRDQIALTMETMEVKHVN
jgi:hypothetical protein